MCFIMVYILKFLKIQFKNNFHFVLWLLNGYFEELGILIWVLLKSEKCTYFSSLVRALQVVLQVGFHKQAQNTPKARVKWEGQEETNDLIWVVFLPEAKEGELVYYKHNLKFDLGWHEAWGTPWFHANSIRKKMVWFPFSSWCDV